MSAPVDFMADFERQMAAIRVAAAREALRRSESGEPAFDSHPGITDVHCHLGALQAHVQILADTIEKLLLPDGDL